jgi:hypothetical protein
LAFALPFAAAGTLSWAAGLDAGSANARILTTVSQLDWSASAPVVIAQLYPPIGKLTVAASQFLFPGSTLPLILLAAVVAGDLVQSVLQHAVRARFPLVARIALLLAVLANPLSYYLVANYSTLFISVAVFTTATLRLARFRRWNATESGFRSGLLLLISALTSRLGIALVAAAVFTAPLMDPERRRRKDPGAGFASALVTGFPTLAAFLLWLVLVLGFHAAAPSQLPALIGTSVPGGDLLNTLTNVLSWEVLLPVAVATATGVAVLRWRASAVPLIVGAVVTASALVGLASPESADGAFLVMFGFAVALLPGRGWRPARWITPAAAIAQLALAWIVPLTDHAAMIWWQQLLAAMH